MFKKLAVFLVALMITSVPAFADSIGYIDLDKILYTYKGAQEVQEKLKKNREEYQKEFEKRQKKIEQAREKKRSEKEIDKLIAKMEEELKPRQEELVRTEADLQRSLLTRIVGATEKTKKEYGIDVVFDKRVVVAGAFDLTDFVLERLNSEETQKTKKK